jgi:hypothetical protein
MAFNHRSLRQIVSNDKVVDSRLLNVLGVQVQRTVAARLLYNARRTPIDREIADRCRDLSDNGIVVLPDFLPAYEFEGLREESMQLLDADPSKLTVYQHGPNTLELARVVGAEAGQLPSAGQFLADHRLHALMQAAEKRPVDFTQAHCAVERLTQGPLGDREDAETQLHSDTFFNTHKAWLYLTDVEMESGPLVYVKRSHRLTFTHLYYIYQESCRRNTRSRRITPGELERLGLRETVLTCPKNTLVVANTFGYHRRLRGEPGRQRVALHVSLRANPFLWWRVH